MNQITATKVVNKGQTKWVSTGREDYGRSITGHTGERHSLADFAQACNLEDVSYGNYTFTPPDNYPRGNSSDTAAERAEILRTQLMMVRDWVTGCKAKDLASCGTATVEIPPTIEELQIEIAILRAAVDATARSRDDKGRYIK